MKQETIMAGVIGLLAGIIVAGFIAGQAVNSNNMGMMRMMGMDTAKVQQDSGAMGHSGMSMADMSKALEGLSGDDFDKAFIGMMIEHHEGAINMAKQAALHAKHGEVKTLASNVITAQTKEINDMKAWQVNWGYTQSSMMDHMHDDY